MRSNTKKSCKNTINTVPLRSPEGSINFRPAENSGVHPLSRVQRSNESTWKFVSRGSVALCERAGSRESRHFACSSSDSFRGVSARAGPRHKRD